MNPAIMLLGIYHPPKVETGIQINTCTQMFTAALFTIAKRLTTQMPISG